MTLLSNHEKYMNRCLQLASMAEGHTYPNPMVGSVIVHNNKIIGEGYHRKAGEPHAEVNAITNVKETSLLKESTLYVNLEPCAHFGKTPPCSKLIIEKQIPKVVVGCIDSFSEVSGKGIKMMEDAGIEVKVGVLQQESLELNRRFFTFHKKKRPYIILKWAQTQDGYIDKDRTSSEYGEPTWITNEYARQAVHQLRTTEQAIMVGTKTAWFDNPSLTARDYLGKQPLRVVIDKNLKLPESLKLFDQTAPTLVITYKEKPSQKNLRSLKISSQKDLMNQVLDELYNQNIQSLIVEGGAILLESMIANNLWDEAHLYSGNCWFKSGIKAPKISGEVIKTTNFVDSKLFVYRNNSLF